MFVQLCSVNEGMERFPLVSVDRYHGAIFTVSVGLARWMRRCKIGRVEFSGYDTRMFPRIAPGMRESAIWFS